MTADAAAAAEEAAAPAAPAPTVLGAPGPSGGKVGLMARVKASGREGVVVEHDLQDEQMAYKVTFADGAHPLADWFARDAVDIGGAAQAAAPAQGEAAADSRHRRGLSSQAAAEDPAGLDNGPRGSPPGPVQSAPPRPQLRVAVSWRPSAGPKTIDKRFRMSNRPQHARASRRARRPTPGAMEPAAAPAEQDCQDDPIGAPMSSTSAGHLEREAAAMANCVTVAKGSRYFDGLKCRVKRSGLLSDEGYSFILNEAVSYAAVHSSTSRAEAHMDKLDSRKGHDPDVAAFNALLEGIGRKGDLGRAEQWFARLQEPALHPELGGLAPNKGTYDVMVQAAAEAGDVRRAEKFLGAMCKAWKPARATYFKVIEALVRAGEIKRAHHMLE
ncbi:unnamed protein product, partial [Prorocentrum cordatum]